MPNSGNEAFSRVLIDKALEFSGWNILNPKQVRFELNGSPGRADYVLFGDRGPLCVLEAKNEDADPYDAKERARGYLKGALMQAREHLRSLASGSTHKTIYFPTVKQFAVVVPPLALQKEFTARVTEIRAVQAVQAANRQRLEFLFQSLLHRAFNGEL